MALNFYDAVVIGQDLPSLLTAALMARRGLRLVVLGAEVPGGADASAGLTYTAGPAGDWALPREPFAFLAAESPALKRVFSELSLLQLLKRRLQPRRPAYQLVLPGHRLEVDDDPEVLQREVQREFPGEADALRGVVEQLDHADEELDLLLGSDLVLPPSRWGERREVARALSRAPLLRAEVDPLASMPERHPARLLMEAPLAFAADQDPRQLPWLARVRLLGHFRRGAQQLAGGLAGLRTMLLERIRSSGGELRERDRVTQVVVRRGKAEGVRLGPDEVIGAQAVVCGLTAEATASLLGDERPRKWATAQEGLSIAYRRYVLNLVIDEHGLPEGMAATVFTVADPAGPLEGANCLWLQLAEPESGSSRRVLTVSCLAPADVAPGDARLAGLRAAVLERVAELMPFYEPYLLAVDSPNEPPADGARAGAGGSKGAQRRGRPLPLAPVYRVQDGFWGVGALDVRTPLKQLYLTGRQVLPGLGFEGDFLTAWSCARVVLEASGRKDLLRRQVLLGGD